MRSCVRRPVLVFCSILVCAATVAAAGEHRIEDLRHFVVPSMDGTPVVLESARDGRAFAAWAYRSGAEFDIAVSVRDTTGKWSRPDFIGRFDGADQLDPAIAIDARGRVYLAFAEADSGRVFVTVLASNGSWSAPVAVSPERVRSASPALAIVGSRLVVAFRTGSRTRIVEIVLPDDASAPLGIQDGPDPLGSQSPSDHQDGTVAPSAPAPIGDGP